jgi:glycerate 2-kinase
VRRADPTGTVLEVPLSDGGEGWLETMVGGADAMVEVPTTGPLGKPLVGRFGLIDGGRTAVVEVATASGLHLHRPTPATFRASSSRGTGALIAAALDRSVERIVVGLGGSATTDGGAGMACALGARLTDSTGRPIGEGGAALALLAEVDLSELDRRLTRTEVLAACDVVNPLLGPEGAAAVYGPQKGGGSADIAAVENGLASFADLVEEAIGRPLRDEPGAGAAGGLGFGLVAFCGAHLSRGIDLALDAVGFDAALVGVDLVITGEGRVDSQTLDGKVCAGVARRARVAGIPCVAIGGAVDPKVIDDWPRFAAAGLIAVESTLTRAAPEAGEIERDGASERLRSAAERVVQLARRRAGAA